MRRIRKHAEQIGGDVVGDNLRQNVGRVPLLPVGAVVGLVVAAQDIERGGGVVAGQSVDVVAIAVRENDVGDGLGCDLRDNFQQFFSARRGRLGIEWLAAFFGCQRESLIWRSVLARRQA